jgi:transcriptional regulator with XRE-family HTH domain
MTGIGERIKEMRLKRGLSQGELARRAGLTQGFI